MDDKTKKILKNTGLFAAAVGITTAKAVKWSVEKAWEHKEEIAGGIVGGAKGVYHMGQNIYGSTIRNTDFEQRLEKLKEQIVVKHVLLPMGIRSIEIDAYR